MNATSAHVRSAVLVSLSLLLLLLPPGARAQRLEEPPPPEQQPLHWVTGPARVDLRGVASLPIPAGYVALADADAARLLRQIGTTVLGNEVGLIAPESRDWFVVVRFSDLGFIPTGPGTTIDPDRSLALLRFLETQANFDRRRESQPEVAILGWAFAPAWDNASHSLEWAVEAGVQNRTVVNHVIGTLGRSGVIQFFLVEQSQMASTADAFRRLVQGVQFKPGESYADHRPQDRAAAGGLELLLTGGKEAKLPAPPSLVQRAGKLLSSRRLVFSALGGWVCLLFGMVVALRRRDRWKRARQHRRRVSSTAAPNPAPSRGARLLQFVGWRPVSISRHRSDPGSSLAVPGVSRRATAPRSQESHSDEHKVDPARYFDRLTRDLYRVYH